MTEQLTSKRLCIGRVKRKFSKLLFEALAKQVRPGWLLIEEITAFGSCDPRWNGARWDVYWNVRMPSGTIIAERAEVFATLSQCAQHGLYVVKPENHSYWEVFSNWPKEKAA